MRRRHAHWFVELLEPRRGWYKPRDPFLASRLLRDRENFVSALEWAAESGESETWRGLRCWCPRGCGVERDS